MNSSLCIILMGEWKTKVHQESIAEILGNVAIILLDDPNGDFLIGTDDLTEVFWVELSR